MKRESGHVSGKGWERWKCSPRRINLGTPCDDNSVIFELWATSALSVVSCGREQRSPLHSAFGSGRSDQFSDIPYHPITFSATDLDINTARKSLLRNAKLTNLLTVSPLTVISRSHYTNTHTGKPTECTRVGQESACTLST